MPVDVESLIEISRLREEVAAYACDPDNATVWYENIKAVEWESPRPLAVGSRIAFVAEFLGRRLAYTYEVTELVPGERFVMSTAEDHSQWRQLTPGRTPLAALPGWRCATKASPSALPGSLLQ